MANQSKCIMEKKLTKLEDETRKLLQALEEEKKKREVLEAQQDKQVCGILEFFSNHFKEFFLKMRSFFYFPQKYNGKINKIASV